MPLESVISSTSTSTSVIVISIPELEMMMENVGLTRFRAYTHRRFRELLLQLRRGETDRHQVLAWLRNVQAVIREELNRQSHSDLDNEPDDDWKPVYFVRRRGNSISDVSECSSDDEPA
ncbi:GH16796 [Drosophila grimshawi]|uniref:GH16796 n=1 Tax=Drosophila grimshawi TaxID=7222 RepID=B4IWS2_DROGR|nr:GH16796 [Drosophila grimshawi]